MRPVGPTAILILVITLIGLTSASMGLYQPSIPAMVRSLHTDFASVQLTLSLFIFGYGLFQIAVGPMSDRFGRRWVMIWFVALYFVSSLVCAMAPTIGFLQVARVFQAAGGCATIVVGRAIVRDVYSGPRIAQAFSHIASAMVLVPVLAPIIGAQIETWSGWRANFVLMAAMGGAALLVLIFFLPETIRRRDPEAANAARLVLNFKVLLRDPTYLGFMMVYTFTFCGIFIYSSNVAIVMIDLSGVSPQGFGLWFSLTLLSYGASAFACGRLTPRLGAGRVMGLGAILVAASGLAMAWVAAEGILAPAAIAAPAVVLNLGAGLLIPHAQAGVIGPYPHMAGTASALSGAVQMVMAALTAAIVGHLYDETALPMAIGMAIAGCATLAVHVEARRRAARVNVVAPPPGGSS